MATGCRLQYGSYMLELSVTTEAAKTTTVATRVPSPRAAKRMGDTGDVHHQHGCTEGHHVGDAADEPAQQSGLRASSPSRSSFPLC